MTSKVSSLLACLLLIAGCGGGDGPSGSPAAWSVSGNWQIALQRNNNPVNPKPQSGFLLASQNTVTGNMMLIDFPCSGVGSVTGTVTGTNVSLVVTLTGLTVNLTGTLGSDQASMSGTYTILPSGCNGDVSNKQETGTWIASLVKPLSGSFQGSFTSVKIGAVQATGQLSQGPNSGASSTSLNGTLAVTGYCFASANISGQVSGTSVVMQLLNADGTEVGQIAATSAVDGSSLKGTYRIVAQGSSGVFPCQSGDSGTVALTL
jgi:hypothetical protein